MDTSKHINRPLDVLVLDDDPDLCMLTESMLRMGKFNAAWITNPDLLKSILDLYAPGIILMDMMLSGQDGQEICRKLKTDPKTSLIKIMMVSAHPNAETTCCNAPADDFLSKSIEFNIFLGKIGCISQDIIQGSAPG